MRETSDFIGDVLSVVAALTIVLLLALLLQHRSRWEHDCRELKGVPVRGVCIDPRMVRMEEIE